MSDLGSASEPLHALTRCPEPTWPHTSDDAVWMEKIMTTHNSEASLEVRELKDELRDDELDAVSGGVVIAIIAILIG